MGFRKRRPRIRRSRTPWGWFLVIMLLVFAVASVLGLGGGLINFLEKHADVLDTQYIPKDLERGAAELLKKGTKEVDKNTLEQLKKRYEQKLQERATSKP